MKTILIIGDSWGVPNYFGEPGVDSKYHTEYLLRDLGYKVYNCALNGAGNLRSLENAKKFLKGESIPHPAGRPPYHSQIIDIINPKIDWVIWFHTEFFRDGILNKDWSLESNLHNHASIQYNAVKEFVESINSKLAVIGGQCPLRNEFFEILNADFIIEDWRHDIMNIQFPKVYTLSLQNDWLDQVKESTDSKLKILDDHKFIYDSLSKSEDFPDGGHPGIRPHNDLVKKLENIL